MDLSDCEFLRLEEAKEVAVFDCGDIDLNDFLRDDALKYFNELLSVTYLIQRGGRPIAFFSVSNDKISQEDTKSRTVFDTLFRSRYPQPKQIKSYPAVKIGRLGVSAEAQKLGIGTAMLDYIKFFFIDRNKTGCRYITVDAYRKSIPFYAKNGFDFLTEKDEKSDHHTRLMYYDLVKLRSMMNPLDKSGDTGMGDVV